MIGFRIPNGVRKVLEEVFPNVKPCTISNNIADVSFLYQQYKDFQQDIEYRRERNELKATCWGNWNKSFTGE